MFEQIIAANMDLVIAGSLILIGFIILVLSRLHLMPSKASPFVIGAIVGIIGLTIFNRAKAKQLKKGVVKLEKQIAERQKQIDAGTKDLERRDEIVQQAQKEYDEAVKNYKRSAVSYQVKDKATYEKMSDEDIFKEFDSIGN